MATSFFNENANRAYPFVLGTVDRPASGPTTTLNLPNGLIVDTGFILGPKSRFKTESHSVYLVRLRRVGDYFFYDFESDAPALFGVTLTFTRHVADENYLAEFTDSGDVGLSESSLVAGSISEGPCDEPLWSGFLVTGVMAEAELLLPSDGEITRGVEASTVEPALLQNLSESYVVKIGIANDDRIRTTAPEDCPELVFPGPVDVIHVAAHCIVGDVVIKPGYNCLVTQNLVERSLTIAAAPGAGAGQPCEEVPLYPGEIAPVGSRLLEGGPRCNEVLRSLNGIGGRQFSLIAGQGVTINSVPADHRIVIDIDMLGLAFCDGISHVSESC